MSYNYCNPKSPVQKEKSHAPAKVIRVSVQSLPLAQYSKNRETAPDSTVRFEEKYFKTLPKNGMIRRNSSNTTVLLQTKGGKNKEMLGGIPMPDMKKEIPLMFKRFSMEIADDLFRKYDTNFSGFLDIEEFQLAIDQLCKDFKLPNLSTQETMMLMQNFDVDLDGLICKQEFRFAVMVLVGSKF